MALDDEQEQNTQQMHYFKIRNAKISRAVYVASKRLDALYRARELLQIVYKSTRLQASLERRATTDCFENDAKRFKLNRAGRASR